MAASGNELPLLLKPEYVPLFSEGITLIFSQWTSIQIPISNGWCGHLSHRNLELLASDVLSYFSKLKDSVFKDDLEDLLYSNVIDYFGVELGDGSDVEVADELIRLHTDLLHGSLESIEKIRNRLSTSQAVSKSKAMVTETSGDDSSSDDDTSPANNKCFDIKENCDGGVSSMAVDEEGWSVVPSRRNKGKRH